MMNKTELLIWGIVIHLICDWIFQNHWIAVNKTNTKHPAGYVHGAIHTLGMVLVFPLPAAVAIGVIHWLIDLRFIMGWWRKIIRQTTEGIFAIPVAIWGDQVVHIGVIAMMAILSTQ